MFGWGGTGEGGSEGMSTFYRPEKPVGREARNGNVLTSLALNSTGHPLRGSCFAAHFVLPNPLILRQ